MGKPLANARSLETFSLGTTITTSFGYNFSVLYIFSLDGVSKVQYTYVYGDAVAYKKDGTLLHISSGTTTDVSDYDILIYCTSNTAGVANSGTIVLN